MNWRLRACPRCGGDAFSTNSKGTAYNCLQCGAELVFHHRPGKMYLSTQRLCPAAWRLKRALYEREPEPRELRQLMEEPPGPDPLPILGRASEEAETILRVEGN